MCPECRELNGFPSDFRNALFNDMVFGNGYDEEVPMGNVGTFRAVNRVFCNSFGQCATVSAAAKTVSDDRIAPSPPDYPWLKLTRLHA